MLHIDNQTILRPPMSWMGYSHDNSTDSTVNQSRVLFHQHCPFDYCVNNQSYLTINNTDTQCVFNRSGILCGGCKPGLSLTLGRPLCQHCSNRYIALLAAFAGAGVALVILLISFNITVTEGTVNDLMHLLCKRCQSKPCHFLSSLQLEHLHSMDQPKLLLANNYALLFGGAMFTDFEVEIPSTLPCFFQVLTEDEEDFLNTIQVTSNTAGFAGSSLYGGYLDECHGMGLSISGLSIFKKIFYFNSSSDLSILSTDPTSVCFCLGTITLKPVCQKQNWSYTIAVYPGETFSIPAVLVGQINGTVPGVVHSTFRDRCCTLYISGQFCITW